MAMFKKRGGCQVRTSKIARTNIRPCDDNFTSRVCWEGFASFIHNENVGARHRTSHRQGRIFFQNRMIYTYGGGGHCRLGRTIHVPDLRSRKALQQKCRGLHGECFTAKEQTPHAWKHCFRNLLFEHPCDEMLQAPQRYDNTFRLAGAAAGKQNVKWVVALYAVGGRTRGGDGKSRDIFRREK